MWWDDDQIQNRVNRDFVLAQLRDDEKPRVDQPLGFGDGLTDDTYLEWIEQKATRIFLILVDLGVPDQIFGVIDDSWDDEDLPLPLDQIDRLKLTYDKDEKLERRFFHRQYHYLLRKISKGNHIVYGDDEVVPLEVIDKRPVAGLSNGPLDKVHRPGRPEEVFLRRRIPLGLGPGQMSMEEFMSGVHQMTRTEHKHLVSLWASYTHQSCGYILLTPVSDGNLKSYQTVIPPSIKALSKQDRRVTLLKWLHCLADGVAFLHSQGITHRSLKPSATMFDGNNRIFISNCGIFAEHEATEFKRGFDKESYDYASPEQWEKPGKQLERPPNAQQILLARQSSIRSRPSVRQSPMAPSSPNAPTFVLPFSSSTKSSSDTSSVYTTSTSSATSTVRPDPLPSDIFSLGCIFLDIINTLLKRTSRAFVSHRSARNKTPGRGGGLPDSSFHKNLSQVESWIQLLAKDASKKEDQVYRGVGHILLLVGRMISVEPTVRPSAIEVRNKLSEILTHISGIEELCCCAFVPQWDVSAGVAQLTVGVSEGPTSPVLGQEDPISDYEHKRVGSADEKSNPVTAAAAAVAKRASLAVTWGNTPEKRYASGGGRTAKPRVKGADTAAKPWKRPIYAGESPLGLPLGMGIIMSRT
jgi:serine/threonine protein kinase